MSTTTQQHIGAATRLLWSVSPIVDIARDGWPKKLHVQAIAALQSWCDGDGEDTQERKERQADWVYAIKGACTHSKTPPRERRVLRQSPMVIGGEVVGVETVSVDYITAQDFFAWLTNQQEAASPLLQLWFKAQGVQAAQPQAAAPAPVVGARAKPRTWWDVSSAYIVEVVQAGQYATAKELYRALEAKAGARSPFDKGSGANHGSLFVREIAQPLSMKTLQNKWSELRALARK